MTHRWTVTLLALAAALAAPAHAVITEPVESGMEASGLVDTDGLGSQPPLSSQKQTVVNLPFTVSSVSVADSVAGLFSYAASSDIGLQELKVFGQLTNTGATTLGNGETALMRVSAQVLDVLTFESTVQGPWNVTFQMTVDGLVSGTGSTSSIANASIDFGLLGAANGSDFGSYGQGTIADTLSVTRSFTGSSVQADMNALLAFTVFRVGAGSSITGALNNTATISLILPEGVTLVDSASGTFGEVIPVPEPASVLLMATGVLALLGWRRRFG